MFEIVQKKSLLIFTTTIFLAIWISKWNVQPKQRDYCNKIPRFVEANVEFDTPNPR
jgi:hypothetical protein